MRRNLVIGNWKMNGTLESIQGLLADILQGLPTLKTGLDVVVLPPTIYISYTASVLAEENIKWGAQNIYSTISGAFTGEISAPMVRDYGCSYVLIGHSERRSLFLENEKFIAEKFHLAKKHDMISVLCIGETNAELEKGQTKEVIARQLGAIAINNPGAFSKCIIAYEPVWAIGTGKTASPEQIQEVHSYIRNLITELGDERGDNVSLLYGGSVNAQNARAIFSMPDIDGGLIGGTSLDANKFLEIVKCIN